MGDSARGRRGSNRSIPLKTCDRLSRGGCGELVPEGSNGLQCPRDPSSATIADYRGPLTRTFGPVFAAKFIGPEVKLFLTLILISGGGGVGFA